MKIVFATNNLHKLSEIRNALGKEYKISGLIDEGIYEEIPETKETLEGNAIEKASFIYNKYGLNCFADDTGLEVEALNGSPGVYSARYAGSNATFEDNVNKLLSEMKNIQNRKARFRTVIAYIESEKTMTFEGVINGSITRDKRGIEGFGYDPVFLPDTAELTFAEMTLEMKNKISHRALALQKFIEFLSSRNK